jgi:PAS domain S-box-containing protein
MKVLAIILILVFHQYIAIAAQIAEKSISNRNSLIVDSLETSSEVSWFGSREFSNFSAPEAFTRSNQIKSTKEHVEALTSWAKYYFSQEDYVKTLGYYFQLTDLYARNNDIDNLAITYSGLISFFLFLKDFELAEKYLAILTREAQNNLTPLVKAHIFLNQGKCHQKKTENDQALLSYYLSLLYFQKAHDFYREGIVHKYIGDVFVQKKMLSYAEYNYRLAITCFNKTPNPSEVAASYTRLAHIYTLRKNNKLNLEYNLFAMRIREKSAPPFLVASSCLNVGDAYWLLGKKDSALFYLNRSLYLAEQSRRSEWLEAVNTSLYNCARAEKKYQEAMLYFITSMEYRTKKNLDRNKSAIIILEANHTIIKSEIQNDLLNQEIHIQALKIKNRRFQIFLFEVAFIIILSFIFAFDILSRKNLKRKNELKELNTRLKKEINIRIEAEGMLNRSEELHRFLAENTVDVISLMDAGMQRIYISPSCERFYGYSAQEILKMNSPLDLVSPAFQVTVNQHLLEMFRAKKSTRYVYKVLRKDGSLFWAEANVNPVLNPETNEVKNMITVVRDVSDRLKHEEELSENSRQKEYLLREIHNRVKNNFAILISLMNMQRDQSSSPELCGSLTDLQLRVRTMSLVHEQLYQTREISAIPFDNYLHHLALIISSSFNNSRIRLVTEIVPCKVAIEMALPLGLIINELITNAYKYAFPGERTGNIWIRLLPENSEKFCVSICDDGVGLPSDFTMISTKSMGSQIVGILVEQIEAKIEICNNGGACFRILFSTASEKL